MPQADMNGIIVTGVIFIIILLLSLVLMSGRGAFLISGYNMMSREKKEKYDEKALCRFIGKLLLVIDFLLLIMVIAALLEFILFVKLIMALFFVVAIGGIIYANTGNRFKKNV